MIKIVKDEKYGFRTIFNTETGEYMRFYDGFQASYPHLIDVGVMGSCAHGRSGLCLEAGIKCYQDGLHAHKPNMTLDNYKKIIDESKDKLFECLEENEIVLKKDFNTGIITSVSIKDICVNDYIWNGTDRFIKVTGINKKAVDSIVKISMNYGKYIFATHEHMFPTHSGLKKVSELSLTDSFLENKTNFDFGEIYNIDVVKMLISSNNCGLFYIAGPAIDKICEDKGLKIYRLNGRRSLKLENIKDIILNYDYSDCILFSTGPNAINTILPVTKELMYLLGHYIGNGTKRSYVISSSQTKMIENIETSINSVFPEFGCNKRVVNNTTIIEFSSKFPHSILFDTVLNCRNNGEKQLPNIIWSVPFDYKISFLRGYFCDGNFRINKKDGLYGEIVFNTSSVKLSKDLCLLLKSMNISYAISTIEGGEAIFSKKEPRIVHRKTRYRIRIGNYKEIMKVYEVIKDHKNAEKFLEIVNSEKEQKYLRDVKPLTIEDISVVDGAYNVVDINVDSNDHLFMTSHGIISHNCALGGAGDVDMHENFEEILAYTRENNIVPNFTTSGLGMTPEKAEICKKYCGAVAVSMYSRLADTVPELALRRVHMEKNRKVYKSVDDIPVLFTLGGTNPDCKWDAPSYEINGLCYAWDELHHMYYSDEPQEYEFYRVYNEVRQEKNYTMNAIKMLLDAGVKTNIHYVLSNTTIDEAIIRLKHNGFPKGINAIVFLLHKPVGLGDQDDVIKYDDPRLAEFFNLIDNGKFPFKIGFDSCTIPGILNFCKNINVDSIDTCEGGRFSMYIAADMTALPCSFDNQDERFAVKLDEHTSIQDAWDSSQFEQFRYSLKNSCSGCKNRDACMGGCPIRNEIVLCNKPERDFQQKG